jgi:hypothetical protein
MATEISGVTQDDAGRTTHVCGPGLEKTAASSVMQAMYLGQEFFVTVDAQRVDLVVVESGDAAYLRTDPDRTKRNNLDFLPPC